MYLVMLKSAVTEALQQAFAASPTQDFIGTFVDIEYPLDKQNYPSVWVNYDDRDSLRIAGIDHREFVTDDDGHVHDVTRWMFSGTVTLTAVALSSRERDALYDELVRQYAFGRIEDDQTVFRNKIENNDFVAVVVNWDELRPGGDAASPGTPWGTDDEVIYEKSLSFDVEGEFVSDASTNALVLLSAITVEGQPINDDGDLIGVPQNVLVNHLTEAAFDQGQWH